MHRCIFVIILGTILAISAVGLRGSSSPSPDSAEAATTGGFPKFSGSMKATYHLSFTDYVQTYDAVTTANLEWEEDPDFFFGCNCRAYFPTGEIEWSYKYAVEYEAPAECTDTVGGTIAVGPGLQHPSEQMLILWDDITDETQYVFSGHGLMFASGLINCDGGFTVYAIDYLNIRGPDEISTTTPTLPPTQQPGPPLSAQGAPVPICDEAPFHPFKVALDSQTIKGSCYQFYSEGEDSLEYVKYEWDLAVPKEPIIFIHGIMGSEIMCGNDELWPHIGVLARPQFLKMALGADGVLPSPGACAASVGDILETVTITIPFINYNVNIQVYKPTVDFLNGLSPGNVHLFNWDWRKAPGASLALLNQLIEEKRAQNDNAKVVIMAHSYGGLLARLYVQDSARAENVARVVTIGTPAWGAASAFFPLYAGIKAPGDDMNVVLTPKKDLHELAKNLTGNYFLFPSQSYANGSWFFDTPNGPPLSGQDFLTYIGGLGGNTALLSQAWAQHASILDPPYLPGPGDPKFEVIVGTGVPTVTSIHIMNRKKVELGYETGDGTVPAESAASGALGLANPNKARTHYVCKVKHVPLPGHPKITDAIKDFLRFGSDIEDLSAPCTFGGYEVEYPARRIPAGGVAGPTSQSDLDGAISIEEAAAQGLVDYLELPNQNLIVAGGDIPEIALDAGAFLTVTPLSSEWANGKGQPTVYGPLNGRVTISAGAGGPVVLVDGEPAPLLGDVNCDEQVTALDTLLILLHAGGTPRAPAADCATIGSGAEPFGDMDCSNSVATSDVLANLQVVSGAPLDFLVSCY